VLLSILDHFLRRPENQGEKVIGTLLGVRVEDGGIEVRNSFMVPHKEYANEVAVDMEHHRTMFDLHARVNPREGIVGWYSTGSALNNYSAHIQDFYSKEATQTGGGVHIVVDTERLLKGEGEDAANAYVSVPVGISRPRSESSQFLPVPLSIAYPPASDKSALDVLALAAGTEERSGSLFSDMDSLERALIKVLEMLERVSGYVDKVVNNEVQGDRAVGRFLMDAVSTVPKVESGTFERMFNSHLQDLLMVVYLANMTRTQLSIGERLQMMM